MALDRWNDIDGGGDSFYSYMARKPGTDRLLIAASPSVSRLAHGVKVLRGELPNLNTDDNGLLLRGPQTGGFLYVAANDDIQRLGEWDPASNVAQLVNGMVFDG